MQPGPNECIAKAVPYRIEAKEEKNTKSGASPKTEKPSNRDIYRLSLPNHHAHTFPSLPESTIIITHPKRQSHTSMSQPFKRLAGAGALEHVTDTSVSGVDWWGRWERELRWFAQWLTSGDGKKSVPSVASGLALVGAGTLWCVS